MPKQPSPQPPNPTSEPPLVGRAREREALGALGRKAFDGEPQVALLSGPAGIGKTRLVAELPEVLPREAVILRGQCVDIPELAWNGILSAFRRVPKGARADEAALFTRLLFDGSQNAETPTLQLLETLIDIVSRWSKEAPLVLCLDDLHWRIDRRGPRWNISRVICMTKGF